MTAPPDYDPDVEARYRALPFLHAQSPDFRDLDLSAVPGFGDLSVDTAMQLVADAPGEEIPVSARLAVLYDLSKTAAPDPGLGADEHSPDGLMDLASSALRLKPG